MERKLLGHRVACLGWLFACLGCSVRTPQQAGDRPARDPGAWRVQATWDNARTQPRRDDYRAADVALPAALSAGHGSSSCDNFNPPGTVHSDDPRPMLGIYPHASPHADAQQPSLVAPCGQRDDCLVEADPRRGIRVIDLRDPSAPRLGPTSPLHGRVLALHATATHAWLSSEAEGGGYDVTWYALDAEARATPLGRRHEAGAFRGSHRVAGEALRIAVVADLSRDGQCDGKTGSTLRVYGPEPARAAAEFELGPGFLTLHGLGDLALATSVDAPPALRLTLLRMDAEGAAPIAELKLDGPVLAATRDGSGVRAVWSRTHGAIGTGEYAATDFQIATFNVRAADTALKVRTCKYSARAQSPATSDAIPLPPSFVDALFFSDRTLLALSKNDGAQAASLVTIRDDDCKTEQREVPATYFRKTREGERLIGLSALADPTLRAQVFAAHTAGPLAAPATLTLPAAPSGTLSWEQLVDTGAMLPGDAAQRRRLLALSYAGVLNGQVQLGTQLLTLAGNSLHAGAQLEGHLWMARDPGRAQVLHGDELRLYDLRDPERPRALSRFALHSSFATAALVAGGVARLRWPAQGSAYDPVSEAPLGQLEFVAADQDPGRGAARSVLPIEGRARLHRVGSRLVGITQALRAGSVDRPCTVRVFDVPAIERARLSAVIRDDSLCDVTHALADQPAYALKHALVFVRTESYYRDPQTLEAKRFAFFVLDLADVAHPRLRGPYRTPRGEWARAVFVENGALHYAYSLVADGSTPERPEVHHYLRSVQLEAETPLLGEPVSLPGQVWRLEGDALFTRDAEFHGGEVRMRLHRARLGAGRAMVEATHDTTGRELALAARLPSGDLLIGETVQTRLVPHEVGTQLRVLAARDLQPRSAMLLPNALSNRAHVRGDTVLLSDVNGGLVQVEVDAAAKLRLRPSAPGTSLCDVHGEDTLIALGGDLRYLGNDRIANIHEF
jgi:hypothetical protein